MLNYVAYKWVEFFVVVGPWSIGDFESTGQFPKPATWPRLTEYVDRFPALRGLTAHPGILLGIGAAILLAWVLYRSRWGYEIRVIGDNPKAARYAGINLARNILLVMMFSGALAGLAGMNEVAALRELNGAFSDGYGFTGVIVAWLARLNPLAAILVAFLFGGLLVGTKMIQPQGIASMLQGVILFVVVGTELLFRYRVRLEKVEAAPGRRCGGSHASSALMALGLTIGFGALVSGTPLLFATIGEILSERAGVMNLGIEGMMLVGAMGGFAVWSNTGSLLLGMAAGMLFGGLLALVHALHHHHPPRRSGGQRSGGHLLGHRHFQHPGCALRGPDGSRSR